MVPGRPCYLEWRVVALVTINITNIIGDLDGDAAGDGADFEDIDAS